MSATTSIPKAVSDRVFASVVAFVAFCFCFAYFPGVRRSGSTATPSTDAMCIKYVCYTVGYFEWWCRLAARRSRSAASAAKAAWLASRANAALRERSRASSKSYDLVQEQSVSITRGSALMEQWLLQRCPPRGLESRFIGVIHQTPLLEIGVQTGSPTHLMQRRPSSIQLWPGIYVVVESVPLERALLFSTISPSN